MKTVAASVAALLTTASVALADDEIRRKDWVKVKKPDGAGSEVGSRGE